MQCRVCRAAPPAVPIPDTWSQAPCCFDCCDKTALLRKDMVMTGVPHVALDDGQVWYQRQDVERHLFAQLVGMLHADGIEVSKREPHRMAMALAMARDAAVTLGRDCSLQQFYCLTVPFYAMLHHRHQRQ